MSTLVVVRHAKSSWKEPLQSDRDRPLNKRGKRDAPFLARCLAERLGRPDLIVSSPALRARTTAAAFATASGYEPEKIALEERVYEASVPDLLEVVRQLPDTAQLVFLFGHNPGMTDLVNVVSSARLDNLPTCGLAEFRSEAPWARFGETTPELVAFDYPKNHPELRA
jgi:phosphohistidine phosphatase